MHITGTGELLRGGRILEKLQISSLHRKSFCFTINEEPVFGMFETEDYNGENQTGIWSAGSFYDYPERSESHFQSFLKCAEILIVRLIGIPGAPRLFELLISPVMFSDLIIVNFCDVNGSVT